MANQGTFIKTDKFGQSFTVVGCKDDGTPFPKGYAELGGKLYKIEPSVAQKEGVAMWVKITQVKKQARPTSM